MQCSLYVDDRKRMCIRDENSTYGTYTEQGRLSAGVWYPLRRAQFFGLPMKNFK